MKTGMVIVNYNDYPTTIKLINNILDYKCLNRIVIVDNKSTDNSFDKLENLNLKKVFIIEAKQNNGYSSALNLGAKYLIDLYKECKIIFSNADIIIDSENDIKTLLNDLSDMNVIVAPNIIEDNSLNRGWHIPKPMDDVALNIPSIRKKYFNKHLKYPDTYYKNHLSKVDTVSGSFFLMTSKHLQNINFFDENVFLYYEENIFGIKTKLLKKNIVIDNDIDVVHNHAISIDKSMKKIKKYDALKKSQYYFEKNYNHANLFSLILLKITIFITRIILWIKYSLS
jgi:N-acetylglucosaminyl-diphospho-decaprenol L-rhamnosyltransferase